MKKNRYNRLIANGIVIILTEILVMEPMLVQASVFLHPKDWICHQTQNSWETVYATESTEQNKDNRVTETSALSLYSTAAVLLDADSKRVLYGKQENEKMAMASTTKIMTCILVLEEMELEEWATVSSYAASMPKVKLGARKGEQIKVGDLLYSLMLESHNDAAVILAEHYGRKKLNVKEGWEEGLKGEEASKKAVAVFAGRMNEKAKELGCKDTCFLTPNGLDATVTIDTGNGTVVQCHETTAVDLATIMAYCAFESGKREQFLQITRTPSYSFASHDGRTYHATNHNAFLNMMEGALSGKTGFTNKAGYCYVGALEKDGKRFTLALLACGWPNHKSYKWSDSAALFRYGLDNYHIEKQYPRIMEPSVLVEGGIAGHKNPYDGAYVKIGLKEELEEYQMLLTDKEQIIWEMDYNSTCQAPITKGEEAGALYIYIEQANGERILLDKIQLEYKQSIQKIKFRDYIMFLLSQFKVC